MNGYNNVSLNYGKYNYVNSSNNSNSKSDGNNKSGNTNHSSVQASNTNYNNISHSNSTNYLNHFIPNYMEGGAGSGGSVGGGGYASSVPLGGTTDQNNYHPQQKQQQPQPQPYHQQCNSFQPLHHQYQNNYPQQYYHHRENDNNNMYYQDHPNTTSSCQNGNNPIMTAKTSVPGYTLYQPFFYNLKSATASSSSSASANTNSGNGRASTSATPVVFDYMHSLQQQNQHNPSQPQQIYNKTGNYDDFYRYTNYHLPVAHDSSTINTTSSKSLNRTSSEATTTIKNYNNNNSNSKNGTSSSSSSNEIENFASHFFEPNYTVIINPNKNNSDSTTTATTNSIQETHKQGQDFVLDSLYDLNNNETDIIGCAASGARSADAGASSVAEAASDDVIDVSLKDLNDFCSYAFDGESLDCNTDLTTSSTIEKNKAMHNNNNNNQTQSMSIYAKNQKISNILDDFQLSIISLSSTPLSATEIIGTVSFRCTEVESRFLPCVNFLVSCQQELRHGLALAIQKNRRRGRNGYTTRDFYQTYFDPLPTRFYSQNIGKMPEKELNISLEGINALLAETRTIKGSFEGMKNTFLGGMRDGESYGLRQWLSKNGGALKICNDIELILGALRELPREEETTKELARILRPIAKATLKKLQTGVPKAYQEVSSAHPYLPFFHRLECALKGLSEFDPEEDNVICIDDSDDEEEEILLVTTNPERSTKSDNVTIILDSESVDESAGSITHNEKCFKTANFDEKCNFQQDEMPLTATAMGHSTALHTTNVFALAQCVETVATKIEDGKAILPTNVDLEFWTLPENYIEILKVFRGIILQCSSKMNYLIDHSDYNIIPQLKNPLCFRDIVVTLYDCIVEEKVPNYKTCPILARWNICEGRYLIQAVDLVFLNNLVSLGDKCKVTRKYIEHQRNYFWRKIRDVSPEKKNIPVRRTETSDFVIQKS